MNTRLKNGIVLFINRTDFSQDDIIQINNGSEKLPVSFCQTHNYRQGAVLPSNSWRELTEMEKYLTCETRPVVEINRNWQLGKSIAICKVPAEMLAILDKLDLTSLQTYNDKTKIFGNEKYTETLTEFTKALLPFVLSRKGFKAYGLNIAPGGLPSITNDKFETSDKRQFIGLHIDENDVVPILEKYKVRNRLSINVGQHARYLYYINLTIPELYKACTEEEPELNQFVSVGELTDQFLERFPDYPIIKVKINPGEAYIAPAQNLIHDACNPYTANPDITLNFMGYFKPF